MPFCLKKLVILLLWIGVLSYRVYSQTVHERPTPQNLNWRYKMEGYMSFSSPRCVDLNNDGVQDIVVGGGIEKINVGSGLGAVFGIDGKTGQPLWPPVKPADNNDVFGSPVFEDVTGDNVPDIFIGGRGKILFAIDGAKGTKLWDFDTTDKRPPTGWKQFYTPQLIQDQDNDGKKDLLVANGGDASYLPNSPTRPPGFLVIISSKTGKVLHYAKVPESKETYCSTVILDYDNNTDPYIIFGTGGETHKGSLWRTRLSDVIAGNIDHATLLLDNTRKGFLAPVAIADLTLDGEPEVIAASNDGYVAAVSLISGKEVWRFKLDQNPETYATPCIGYFNRDSIPDVAVTYLYGAWPIYQFTERIVIDGSKGTVLRRFKDKTAMFDMQSLLAMDGNGDGVDELIALRNAQSTEDNKMTLHIEAYDIGLGIPKALTSPIDLPNPVCTPLIADLNLDGKPELVYQYGLYALDNRPGVSVFNHVVCQTLDIESKTPSVSWAEYIGPAGTGLFCGREQFTTTKLSPLKPLVTTPYKEYLLVESYFPIASYTVSGQNNRLISNQKCLSRQLKIPHSKLGSGYVTLTVKFYNGTQLKTLLVRP